MGEIVEEFHGKVSCIRRAGSANVDMVRWQGVMSRFAWLAVVAMIGCSSAAKPVPEPARLTPVTPDAAPAVTAADPPEPTAPLADCAFTRTVFCVTGEPTLTALQPSPFEWCPRTQPARQESVVPQDAQFSAAETRQRRASSEGACCYVEFSTMACD
jgi:hypothetical protein